MKQSNQQFRARPCKAVTLLGMSGVGKTTLAGLLPSDKWFHYSGDYRIGTRYLNEEILDQVKLLAMQQPELRQLLQNDHIAIHSNLTVHNLDLLSFFLGKLGNPAQNGLGLSEFKRRQRLFCAAEKQAMQDVAPFIRKGRQIYGYPNFLNDAGGSICSLESADCWHLLSEKTLILYLEASEEMEQTLIERARHSPKPMNYDEAFLDANLKDYLSENGLMSADEIAPDAFVQWIFPRLINYRRPQYRRIADRYGYTIDARQVPTLRDEQDFIDLVCSAIDAQPHRAAGQPQRG